MGEIVVRYDIIVDGYLSDKLFEESFVLEAVFKILVLLEDHGGK